MALLNLSFYNDGKSPYLEFEKIGNRIYVDFQYHLSSYDSDYYDGDVTFDMGKTERNDKVNNGFRDTLSLDFYSVVSPGKTVEGGYELNDYTDGVSLSLHFKLTSFDEQTNFTGTSKVDVVFGSIYNDTIKGGNGNDYLVGYQGRDIIEGGNGRDLIAGGKGADRLTGGDGDDKFFFYDTPGKTFDVITDFDPAHETIWLDDAEFSPLSAHGDTPVKLNKEFFSSNTLGKARDGNDYIIYESDTGKLFFDTDGVGGEKGIHIATLDDHLRVTANDFMIF